MGEVQVRGFIGKIIVQFTAVVARDARRRLLSGTQRRTKGCTFTLNQHGSFLTQPNGSKKVTMSREGNTNPLKIVSMLKPRDAQSVTSLKWKRELENVRCELRNLWTGQHENERENTTGKMAPYEKIAHERTGHATHDPRRQTFLKVQGVSVNTSTKGSCGSCILRPRNSQEQSTRCRSQDLGRCWTARRNVCESRASQRSKNRRSGTGSEGAANTLWKHSSVL